jgi:hypothetical protein
MLFNPADKSNSIISHIDFLLFGDGSTFNTEYSLIDRTRNVNITWDEVVSELYKADPNHKWDDTTNSDLPFATTALLANQNHYDLLDSALVIHRVRMKDQSGKYVTLTPVLRRELTDSELESTGTPEKYYKIGGVVFPIPVPDYGATDGVELEFQRGANHFTISDTDKEPGFNSQFHQLLPVSAALMYAIAHGMSKKIQVLLSEKERIKTAMTEHYERRSPDEQPQIRLRRRSRNQYGL